MLISPAHIGALGARPAGAAVAQASIVIAPHDPPAFSSLPAIWSPTVTVANLAQVKWAVFQVSTANPPVWTSTSSFTTVVIAGSNASFSPSAQMLGARDRLVVRSMDDSIEDISGPAALNTPPPAETAGLIAAQLFIADLTVGMNIDRDTIIQAGLITTPQLQEYKDQGITHVRFFPHIGGIAGHNYPAVATGGLDWLFTAAERAMGVGLKVLMNLIEIADPGQLADSRVMPYVSACATRIAGRGWDVNKYALGAVNEYAGGTNTEHRAKMVEGVATLRAQLPSTLLLCASAGWNAPDVLTNGTFVPPPDDRILIEWHYYDDNARNISAAQHWQDVVSAWATQNNRVTIASEWGLNDPASGWTDTAGYPEVVDAAARGMGQQRPTFWAVTDGAAFRFNQGSGVSSAVLKTELATAIGAADDHIRAQAYFQPAGGSAVTRLQVLHRGEGNAILAMQYGGDSALRDTLASLTQLPVDLISRTGATADNTVHSETSSFFDNGQPQANRWLSAAGNYTTSPAGWANQAPMTQTLSAVTTYVSSNAAVPLFDFQVHWESDLAISDASARTAYRGGHWEPTVRIRAARAKEAGKHVAFYGYCPFQGGSWAALGNINAAWIADLADATRTAVMACGNMMDGEPNTQFDVNGDLSHWGIGAAPRIYPRVAFRMAKYAWDRGWLPSNVDLSDCPAMGPRILSAARSGNLVNITVAHDRGTALVAGTDGIDWAAFTFSDDAGTSHVAATSGSITGASTIQATFPSTPPVGGRVWYCLQPNFRRTQLVRDNWASIRPSKYGAVPNVSVVEFPLQRTLTGVSYT